MILVVSVNLFALFLGYAGEEARVGFVAEFKERVLICYYCLVLGLVRRVFLKLLIGESHSSGG